MFRTYTLGAATLCRFAPFRLCARTPIITTRHGSRSVVFCGKSRIYTHATADLKTKISLRGARVPVGHAGGGGERGYRVPLTESMKAEW